MYANTIPPPSELKMSGDLATNWETFKAEFQDFMLASGLHEKPAEVQAATLRRVMGSECRHIYRFNLNLNEEQQKSATAILDALEGHFKPTKNVIFERFVFGSLKQEEGETIDCFVTRLREKAATCDYGQLKDDLIRDRLVLGIADENARRRLLRERTLSLASAIDICRAAEHTDSRMKVLMQARVDDSINATVSQKPVPQSNTRPSTARYPNYPRISEKCKYCGSTHNRGRSQCPAFGKNCRLCGTPNHFATVCLKAKRDQRQLHTVDDQAELEREADDEDNGQIYTASATGSPSSRGKKWFVNLQLHGTRQRCQLDSGATCNVMSLQDKRKIAPKVRLKPSQTRLKLYSGEVMKSLGLFQTECFIKGLRHKLEFEIVKADQNPLLSGSTCERLGLMHITIPDELHNMESHATGVLTEKRLTSAYQDVFNSPIESLPGEVHFDLDRTVTPVQCSPRNVPVALREAVKVQLDKHIQDGNLASVTEPTDWISNMVIVKKADKIRICIDPRALKR